MINFKNRILKNQIYKRFSSFVLMKKINFLTTLMVYIFIIVFLKESIESENSYFNFYDFCRME
ncbi:hypothetical protein LEP1GSC082_3712 [Leptospira kirschneri str. H2]|uniref:Uncharacterized protein n=2 Tax=Leptospira kirschneri TaxID=29507 RepID=A0A0E2BDH0_9LEPT|nr:hypothetical protein LEP1GSC081_1091 [Leptospira kirschneri str. H1]EKO59966.1 hypothetical protein LEP1GSC082_3712 [Leptospira kirschneri str. H2]EMK25855.1 hypothetical protein LEP1GSC008_2393 [Leptospira kirschneri serovar Bulgarica str. Nikolaevo]